MARPLTSIEPLLPVIRRRPLGVVSDIDGTLSPIVSKPEEATVPEEVRSLLRELIAEGVKVALITGRTLETARKMVAVDDAAYAADHGLTLWLDGGRETAPGLAEYEELARQAKRELSSLAESIPGVQLEEKGPLLAVHYRRTADQAAARREILAGAERSGAARRFQTHEGRMVVELRPPLEVNKGTALETLAARLALKGVICLGDDITDIEMFAAARRLKTQGVAAVSVAMASEEAAPEVAAAADYTLAGVEGVQRTLAELVRVLP